MPARLRIALLIESSRSSGRELLQGVAHYAKSHGRWSFYHYERTMHDAAPNELRDWRPDGIIARVESPQLIRQLTRMTVPIVDVLGWHPLPGIPAFGNDRREVIRLAVDHLLQRGFRNLAYCGFPGLDFAQSRGKYFLQFVNELGVEGQVFNAPKPRRQGNTATIEAKGLLHAKLLTTWLNKLPKPVGLIACNDVRAQQVLNMCNEWGIRVPDDVAVVGVDNDPLICEFCDPPLSSVALNNEKIGHDAAAMLESMILKQHKPSGKTIIVPLGVVTRQSSDVLAISDPEANMAIRFIREHACDGITVDDVLEHVMISSSTLKRRFADSLGRSPKEEIMRVQLQQIRQSLAMTNLPLSKIAHIAGFTNVEYMCRLFKNRTGQTPGQYRKDVQK